MGAAPDRRAGMLTHQLTWLTNHLVNYMRAPAGASFTISDVIVSQHAYIPIQIRTQQHEPPRGGLIMTKADMSAGNDPPKSPTARWTAPLSPLKFL